MAEEQQDQPKSYFPSPPRYFNLFTDLNVTALAKVQSHTFPTPLPELSPELRYLVPPTEPIDGKWKSFGDVRELHPALPALEDQGIERLYPAIDDLNTATVSPKVPLYLTQISRSIIANYLELLGILAVDSAQAESKVKVLRDLFINGEHLINLYRPHQARESLILMMEEHLEGKKEVIRRVQEAKTKVEATMNRPSHKITMSRTNAFPPSNSGRFGLHSTMKTAETLHENDVHQRSLWAALTKL